MVNNSWPGSSILDQAQHCSTKSGAGEGDVFQWNTLSWIKNMFLIKKIFREERHVFFYSPKTLYFLSLSIFLHPQAKHNLSFAARCIHAKISLFTKKCWTGRLVLQQFGYTDFLKNSCDFSFLGKMLIRVKMAPFALIFSRNEAKWFDKHV